MCRNPRWPLLLGGRRKRRAWERNANEYLDSRCSKRVFVTRHRRPHAASNSRVAGHRDFGPFGWSVKNMRRTAVSTLVLVTLLVVPSAEGARLRPAKHVGCPVLQHVVVADAQAEVYETEGRSENEMFACAYASGHAYPLGPKPEAGTSSGGGGVEKVTLSGSVVGYQEFVVRTEASSRWTVVVRDLRTGRVLHRADSTGSFVQDIVLKPDGAVAWIVDTNFLPAEHSVVALDKSGIRTLASGPSVVPSSLALAGSTLYWTQAAKPFSAVLN
jgi:hypothetical protein